MIPPKLKINNAKKLRHYWVRTTNRCDCGCTVRIFVRDWICLDKLREVLNEQGYSVEKNYEKKDYCELCEGLK